MDIIILYTSVIIIFVIKIKFILFSEDELLSLMNVEYTYAGKIQRSSVIT